MQKQNECFTKSMNLAKNVSVEMNVEPIIPTKHHVLKKTIWGEQWRTWNQSPKEPMKYDYFLIVVDMIITFLKKTIWGIEDIWKYLYIFIWFIKVKVIGW